MCCIPASPNDPANAIVPLVLTALALIALPQVLRFVRMLRNLIRSHAAMKAVFESLTPDELLQMVSRVEALGNEPSRGCLLIGKHPRPATGRCSISIPTEIPDFPWAGSMLTAQFVGWDKQSLRNPVEFSFEKGHQTSTTLSAGARFFWPPFRRDGKKRGGHVLSVDRYLKLAPDLSARMAELCPDQPAELFDYILNRVGIGSREVRLGLHPEWQQTYRRHTCPECKRPMRLIAQITGSAIHKRLSGGEFYFFGCVTHPQITASDQDWD